MGNEYTVTCSSHGTVIYCGSNKSDYNYYRNGSRQCSRCHEEDNEAARKNAEQAAERRRSEEEARVRRIAAENERKERARQIAREEARKKERLADQKRLREKREAEAAQREQRRQKMEDAIKQTTENLEKEAGRLSALKLQKCDPFLQYKKLDTLQTVKEIGKQVIEVAVVGEVVKERVAEITTDLIDTLGDDYQLIKGEMDRYETYGEEMSNMTNVFKTELQKAFNVLAPDTATDSATKQNESTKYQKLIDEEDDDDDAKEYYQSKKTRKDNEVKRKLKAVDDAIKAIQCKLKVMESYYDQMMEDYEYFVRFMNTKEDELREAVEYFQSVASDVKQLHRSKLFVHKDSDLYDEYKSKPQILSFTEEYEYKDTTTSRTGIEMGDAIAIGSAVGAVTGGAVGAVCGGGPGLVVGAVGGCIIGAACGAIVGLCNKPEYKVGYTTKIGTVTVTSDLIAYQSKAHAKALEEIVRKVQDSQTFKNMQKKLKEHEGKAKNQKEKLRKLKTNMMKVQQPLTNYMVEMKKLRTRLSKGDEISEDDSKMIDKQLQKFRAKMETTIKSMDK
eukprot:12633_1